MRRRVAMTAVVAVGTLGMALSAQAGGHTLTEATFGAPPGGFAAYHAIRVSKDSGVFIAERREV